MELTRKQAEQLKKDAQRALDSMEKGMTAQEAAAELYVRAMPGKDREAGLAAAQRIERIVTEYALLSGEARRDPDGWIDCRLDALGEGLDCAQRCAVLMQLLGEVMAVQRGEAAPQDGFDAAQASEELEAELRGRIRQALECSTLGAAELDSLQQAMQQMQCGGTRRFADFGAQRHDICVVEGMLAYIAAQERAEEVTPEEAAVSVCLAQDAKRVLMDAAEGVLTEEEAARTMAMVGRAAHMQTRCDGRGQSGQPGGGTHGRPAGGGRGALRLAGRGAQRRAVGAAAAAAVPRAAGEPHPAVRAGTGHAGTPHRQPVGAHPEQPDRFCRAGERMRRQR